MQLLRSLAAVAVSLAAAVVTTACGPTPAPGTSGGGDSAQSAPALRVGLEAKYEPFEFTDKTGAVVGFDVDLVTAFAGSLGRTPRLVAQDFEPLISELQSGRIDVICSGMSYTAERALKVDFTRPYLRTTMGVLVGGANSANVRSIADLDAAGVVVAVQRGTTGETKARESFPKATIEPYETEVDAASQVEAGRAQAFVYDMASVRKLAAKAGARVRVLDGDLGSEEYCMAFPKGSPLVARANAFLEEASKPAGLVDTLVARWKPTAEPVRPGTK